MARPQFIQAKTTTLLVSISEAETTEIKLKKLVDAYGNELSMADFGGTIGYLTIDPGGDAEEIISFTDFTVNSDETVSIDTGIVRGLVAVSPYGAGGTASAHSAGVKIVVSNNPQMYEAILDYIDGIALAGVADSSPTAKGIVEQATQAEVDAKSSVGSTGAPLAFSPDKIRTSQYNDYVVDTGIADAYAIAPNPAITAYTAGQEFTFKAQNANTGACTLNVNGLGAKTLKKNKGISLVAGDIQAGQIIKVVYDGTNMELVVPTSPTPQVTTFTSSGTWTKDDGLKYVVVEVQGSGANGVNATGTSSSDNAGRGSAAGGYAKKIILASALAATETISVGAADGTTNSTFGAHCTGGYASGDTPGTATGGDINIDGQNGCAALNTDSDGDVSIGGTGGNSVLGLGGQSSSRTTGDRSATGYGAGGGGGSRYSGYITGGVGGGGVVIVTEYY